SCVTPICWLAGISAWFHETFMLFTTLSAPCVPNNKVFPCVRRSEEYRLSRIMEPNWTKADFKNPSSRQAAAGDRLRGAQEALARDLSISLSAFLRTSVTASYARGHETLFSDFMKDESPCCCGLALIRPQQCRLLLQVEYSVLFPIMGTALGA